MESINSLFFRFMPKRIAEKVTNLGTKKLSFIAAGVVAFAGLNLLFKCVPLILVLAVGYALGIKIDAPKIFLFCQVLCSALIWLIFGHIFGAGVLFIMCAAPIIMYRKKRYIAMAVASFDLFLGSLILSDLGWFLFLIQLIALMVIYRRMIAEFALDYIEYGTLGPLDKITGMIPVRRGKNGTSTSELPAGKKSDSQ